MPTPTSTPATPQVRDATPDDTASALACYARNGYGGGIAKGDRVVVATAGDHIVGVGRLATEHERVILRGMFLDAAYRGRGTGTAMLARLVEHIGGHTSWLITSPPRFRFYAQAGFAPVEPGAGPVFLEARARGYVADHGPQAVLMRPIQRGAP